MLPSSLVILTDLDDTLLDPHNYSWAAAEEALAEIARRRVPLVFVTSKTRAEVEELRRKMGSADPFITENGGGIYVPHGYFREVPAGAEKAGHYHVVALARPYAEVLERLSEIADETSVSIAGFHQMSAREIAHNTGLTRRQAELARQREFDEPFFFAGETPEGVAAFQKAAEARRLQLTRGGRFWHASAGSDKGRAVRKLIELFRKDRRSRVRSVSLGDAQNDLPMLAATDEAVLLPQANGEYEPEVVARLPRVARGVSPGPEGWNEAVLKILASR